MERHFTGRTISLTSAVGMASQIVIARLQSIGGVDAGAPGQKFYDHATASVLQWLRGKPTGDDQITSLSFAYTVQGMPESVQEETPVVGERYILFLTGTPGNWTASKILLADEKQTKSVMQELGIRLDQ